MKGEWGLTYNRGGEGVEGRSGRSGRGGEFGIKGRWGYMLQTSRGLLSFCFWAGGRRLKELRLALQFWQKKRR